MGRFVRQDGPVPRTPVSVEVVEPRIADRVRRGADLYWLVMYAALAFLAISLSNLAVGTAGALEQDLAGATSGVPRLILALLAWVSGTGVLLLPIAVGIDLVVRQRAWQFVPSLVGAAIAAGIGLALSLIHISEPTRPY